ncbi:hypothetical protein CTRI78_v003796 [Colletotrichum trifolii]|uniref:Uncharacterized protein n=1 Tax=Colletotrichum trifolii TaxID=5466 RepID=A0A4R8RV43_COLTR|nr:hypothetical protein CTRI78_v003796 [Colletotrichum trifolii]
MKYPDEDQKHNQEKPSQDRDQKLDRAAAEAEAIATRALQDKKTSDKPSTLQFIDARIENNRVEIERQIPWVVLYVTPDMWDRAKDQYKTREECTMLIPTEEYLDNYRNLLRAELHEQARLEALRVAAEEAEEIKMAQEIQEARTRHKRSEAEGYKSEPMMFYVDPNGEQPEEEVDNQTEVAAREGGPPEGWMEFESDFVTYK